MTSPNPDNRDLSRACWRCQHFDGIVFEVHSSCKRGAGSLQASPAHGCVFWAAGPNDARPIDWMPAGCRLTESRKIWGDGPSAPPPSPPSWETGRPGRPSEAAEWDRQQERQAWRATDALLGQIRGPAKLRLCADMRPRLMPVGRRTIHRGPDDQSSHLLV